MSGDQDFIKPEILNSPKDTTRHPESKPVTGKGGVIVASKILPDRIFLLPVDPKPVFPGLMFPLVLNGGPQAETLKRAYAESPEHIIGFVLTREAVTEESGEEPSEFYRVGTAARILRIQEGPDGAVQALLQGEKRFHILKAAKRDGKYVAQVAYLEDLIPPVEEVRASGMAIINTMRELIKHNPLFSEEIKMFVSAADWDDPGKLADFAANMTSATREELQGVLEALDVQIRLEKVLFILRKELDLNQLKEKITHQIEEKITKQQREFFLREQLKVINKELGLEKDEKSEEIARYEKLLDELDLNKEAEARVNEELDKLRVLSTQSPEFSVSRNYLDWLTSLPWNTYSKEKLDIKRARRILNRDHYGLEDVKKRILEFVGVAKLRGGVEGSILCLIGPPGVGKTSLGKGIAESLGREFFRFSLGGMRDEAEIKGHRRTYIGALPGKIMQAVKNVGTANPVIMLDEIDKVGKSFQGDPASALLEVLDPEQNHAFRDHYLDVPFDLSKTLFIATANVPDTIPGPLFDRMEVIQLSGYITAEKLSIARRHLVPRVLVKNALTSDNLRFTTAGLRAVITGHAREAGVRGLEKALNSCARKVAAGIAAEEITEQVTINPGNVADFLGQPVFTDDPLMRQRKSGVVMGLAWTPLGGTTLYIEAVKMHNMGTGLKLTGQLGDVMKESSHIAYSVVSGNTRAFGVSDDYFKDVTIHLHVPAGATPKDGPSAGITMATALVSLATGIKVPAKWAMTGELTLTGRVLPVGGIKEKVIAAKRSKVKHVILPEANRKDFEDIPEKVIQGVTPHFVEEYKQVFTLIFKK
ncbi:MAG: endopeptidase La [Lentisphaeria bacterium]|nr:endopeptidase La [Lentisphaeria bacterium]